MNNRIPPHRNKKIGILIVVLVALILSFFQIKVCQQKDNKPESNNYTLLFNDDQDTLFVRARVWGYTGDHTEILLSSDFLDMPGRAYNESNDFLFSTSEIFFKTISEDSLIIFSQSLSKIPYNFNPNIKVVQNRLRSYDDIVDFKQNYQSMGFSIISVY